MPECLDCFTKVSSAAKHRAMCPVRNNKSLRDGLESIEFWLKRLEGYLNAAYRAIARYTQVGPHPLEYRMAKAEFENAAGIVKKLPQLLERIQGHPCERVAAAQLAANALGMQTVEVRDIVAKLSPPKGGKS